MWEIFVKLPTITAEELDWLISGHRAKYDAVASNGGPADEMREALESLGRAERYEAVRAERFPDAPVGAYPARRWVETAAESGLITEGN